MRKKIKTVLSHINDNEALKERDRFFAAYWQNIILVAALIVFLLFTGKFIIDQKDKFPDSDSVAAMSSKTVTRKRAYLTFDDGPSDQTGEILDILKEHNVKATFFVIGRNERYYPMYKRIVEEGHTLAIHSYSHEYSTIYASYDNFVNDVEELRKLLYDVTGVDCRYYRFPGGSSNRVTQVPVNDLIDYLDSAGLTYFDWNALNEDAVNFEQSPQQLNKKILKDVRRQKTSIVLMHDLHETTNTVKALDPLIKTLKKEGYQILPITKNTKPLHHVSIDK
mgnify:CR=1 FL=1